MPRSETIQAAIMCEEPCEFEYRDGLIYITDGLGGCRAYRLQTFYRMFSNAARCMQECHGAQVAEIIVFPTEVRQA